MRQNVQALDQYLSRLFEKKKLTGLSVTAFGPEGEVFAKGYGKANADGSLLCDENTMMGIASMSKSHASLCLAILAAEGKVSFDDPVYKFFPTFKVPGAARDAVTLRHLAMHTAGIPPIEPLEWSIAMHLSPERHSDWATTLQKTAPNPFSTIDQVIDYIATLPYETLGAPGEVFSYCNEGYALLSYAVDLVAGMPLEDFLKARVYGPLGMTRTVLDVDASEAREVSGGNITSLFSRDDDDSEATCDDAWSVLPPFRACGLVKSTAKDMATYYRCLSNYGMHEGKQVIPREAVELLIGLNFPLEKRTNYCLGLYKRAFEGHAVCEHSGALHGASSHGGLLLNEGWGFAALCNLDDQDVDVFVHALMNWVLGLPLSTSHRWYAPVGHAFSNPEMVEGTYRAHEGIPAEVTVYQENGVLMAAKNDLKMPLDYCGGTLFAAIDHDKDDVRLRMEALIRGGKAWGVRCGSRVYQRI